jgi:hypothetical protein
MNFIFFLAVAGTACAAGWLANDWATNHALALAMGEQWSIQSEGWAALWPPVAVGLLAGAVPAFALGLAISGRIAQAIQAGKDEATEQAQKLLSEQRRELTKKRAGIDAEIQEFIQQSTALVNQRADKIYLESEKKDDTILRLQRKIEIIEKRLAGSKRARADRQKKAQLKSV